VVERAAYRSYSLDGDFTVAEAAGSLDGDFTVATVAGFIEAGDVVEAAKGIDQDAFKAAMRVLPSGVVMVTTRVNGRPWGLTISACCSVSADPPQIVISIGSRTTSCREILGSNRFGVSILAADQKELAERGSIVGLAKFVDEFCETRGDCEALDSPMISGALFHLDCEVAGDYPVSDHHLIVGLVHRAIARASGESPQPLLYFDRRFWNLGSQIE
jgi:flavin reductase ActVB